MTPKKNFDVLHASTKLQSLTELLLSYPPNKHDELSSRLTYMLSQPVHKGQTRLEPLGLAGVDKAVILQYTSPLDEEMFRHRFTVYEDGQPNYLRRAVDSSRSKNETLSLAGRLEIIRHPDAIRQVAFIVPLVMAALVNLGTIHRL